MLSKYILFVGVILFLFVIFLTVYFLQKKFSNPGLASTLAIPNYEKNEPKSASQVNVLRQVKPYRMHLKTRVLMMQEIQNSEDPKKQPFKKGLQVKTNLVNPQKIFPSTTFNPSVPKPSVISRLKRLKRSDSYYIGKLKSERRDSIKSLKNLIKKEDKPIEKLRKLR